MESLISTKKYECNKYEELLYKEYEYYKAACEGFFQVEEEREEKNLENEIYELKELFAILINLEEYKKIYECIKRNTTLWEHNSGNFNISLPQDISAFFIKRNDNSLWYFLRDKELIRGQKDIVFLTNVETNKLVAVLQIKDGAIWYSRIISDIDVHVQEFIKEYAKEKELYYGCPALESMARAGYLGVHNKHIQIRRDYKREVEK